MANTFYITLHVDTANITPDNLETTCRFTQVVAGAETTQPDTIHDFTTEVQVGDTVIWNGIPSPANDMDRVDIGRIIDTGGPNVFTNLSTTLTVPQTVTGSVELALSSSTNTEDDETYTIEFSVHNNQAFRGSYSIDPIIKVKPSGK